LILNLIAVLLVLALKFLGIFVCGGFMRDAITYYDHEDYYGCFVCTVISIIIGVLIIFL